MKSSSGWFRGSKAFGKKVLKVFKKLVSVPPQTGWCSTCFATKCRCSSTSRGEDQSHHGARANHKGKLQGAHQGMKALLCHPLPGGFSGVQETSFNVQSCSYQVEKLLLSCHFFTDHKCHIKGGIQPQLRFVATVTTGGRVKFVSGV